MQNIHLTSCKGSVPEPALPVSTCFIHSPEVNRKSSLVFIWLWSGPQHSKVNLPTVQRKNLPAVKRTPELSLLCYQGCGGSMFTETWKRTVWTVHWGFQLRGSFNPESLLLQKATDVSLFFLGSSYLDRHHRDTMHNKGLFEFSARDCALTPDHWRADLIAASRCLCEILEFLSFTNTS